MPEVQSRSNCRNLIFTWNKGGVFVARIKDSDGISTFKVTFCLTLNVHTCTRLLWHAVEWLLCAFCEILECCQVDNAEHTPDWRICCCGTKHTYTTGMKKYFDEKNCFWPRLLTCIIKILFVNERVNRLWIDDRCKRELFFNNSQRGVRN